MFDGRIERRMDSQHRLRYPYLYPYGDDDDDEVNEEDDVDGSC